jgi:hypothetical protein
VACSGGVGEVGLLGEGQDGLGGLVGGGEQRGKDGRKVYKPKSVVYNKTCKKSTEPVKTCI